MERVGVKLAIIMIKCAIIISAMFSSVICLPQGRGSSYDPVILTPLNGLRIKPDRSPLLQSNAYNDVNNNAITTTVADNFETIRDDDDGRRINWPFGRPTLEQRGLIRPTQESALFRSTLPENQRRPSAYPISYYSSQPSFPLLNSPAGVRPGISPSRAPVFSAEGLPPETYFTKDPNVGSPRQFHTQLRGLEGTSVYAGRSPAVVSNFRGRPTAPPPLRRIPDSLRRTQYYPTSPHSPVLSTPQQISAYSAPGNPVTDVTFHSFYAPGFKNYVPITKYHHDANPSKGQYNVEFETGNGIYQKESGYIKKIQVFNARSGQYETRDITVKTGTVSWTSPEGTPFTLSYIADENGFRPVGNHIPSDGSANGVVPKNSYTYNNILIPPNPLHHQNRQGKR